MSDESRRAEKGIAEFNRRLWKDHTRWVLAIIFAFLAGWILRGIFN